MKILFTAETRPRISSGVTSCTMLPRMMTLMLSKAPMRKSIANENQSARENPKKMVAMPKPVTHQSNVLPALGIGGR